MRKTLFVLLAICLLASCSLFSEDVRRFFPKSYTQKDVYNAILKLIGEDYQRRERARKNRDER